MRRVVRKWRNRWLPAAGLAVLPLAAAGQGFLDFNVYPYLSDVDSDAVFTLNIASKLEGRWSYFSLLNLYNQPATAELSETSAYYTEQNLRWQIREASAFDLSIQHNMRSGDDNDRLRLGLRWRLNDSAPLQAALAALNLRYALTLHALQIDDRDESVWQLEHSFRFTFPALSDRLYLAGFIDHTFNETLPDGFPANPVVAELQLGWRLRGELYAVSEYRLNQYRRQDVNNLALGLQYRLPF